jgi:hypothetical protein
MHAVAQADEVERGLDVLAPLGLRKFRQKQRQFYILKRSQHRHEIESLKDVADVRVTPNRQLTLRHSSQVRSHNLDVAFSRTIDSR